MALPTTDISISAVKAVLSESTNNLSELCTSANLNQWAKYKPAKYGIGNDAWSENAVARGAASATQGYRLGDFRGYNHDATPPLRFYATGYSLVKLLDTLDNGGNNTPALLIGEMYPITNRDGFNPDFVVDPNVLTLTPQIYDGTTLEYSANVTLIDRADYTAGDTISLEPLQPSSINVGSYTLKCKQQYGAGLNDAGLVQNDVTLSVTQDTYWTVTINSMSWKSSGADKPVTANITLSLNWGVNGTSASVKIEMIISSSAGVVWKDTGTDTKSNTQTVTKDTPTNVTFGTIGTFASGDTITCNVYYGGTSNYQYDTDTLTI
jgi:hypothetical protein